ncbi:hypothetical protein [Mesobacillus stamsii]|uniref:Uncharacterized protein n=1 Tax=Mesobacillus stamsii TaxID=225347 RepID=A0ABU0FSJ5_9BACI|nr:hypothetical protein [Mesobacillus stamsii]MDQ0412894.1 hypothetical protein [Mesobacillus stamsii]
MIRKTSFFFLVFVLFLSGVSPINSHAASGILKEYYPPSDSDYYQKKISFKYYIDFGTTQIKFIQYNYDANGTEVLIGEKTFPVKENSDIWIDQTCKGNLAIQFLDSAGNIQYSMARGQTESYLDQGDCSVIVSPSNFNEILNQYADDTFGATVEPPGTPAADGTGGDGTGGIDTGTGGTDPGTGEPDSDGDGTPDAQDPYPNDPNHGGTEPHDPTTHDDVFHSPHWDDYMKKVDEVISKIPPPPNWDEVAGTFRDTIAPQIKQDLQDLLGSTPTPPAAPTPPAVSTPTAPAELGGLDDGGITAPTGTEAPGLDGSGFSSTDIKTQAPQITEKPDESGGFEINDPLIGLPSQEEFKQNQPAPQDLPAPAAPAPQDLTAPAAPTDPGATAPLPVDSGAIAPTPTDPGATAPTPGDDGATAPLPGDIGGTYPLPGATTETAPIPGTTTP